MTKHINTFVNKSLSIFPVLSTLFNFRFSLFLVFIITCYYTFIYFWQLSDKSHYAKRIEIENFTISVIKQQIFITAANDEPDVSLLITHSTVFMSYWPSKFHTYIQAWLTGLWGIVTSCCYRDQRNCEKKRLCLLKSFIYKDKSLIIVWEIRDSQSTYQRMYLTYSHTQVNKLTHMYMLFFSLRHIQI